jgi:hypothetical protein
VQGSLRQGEKLFLQALTGEMVGSVGRGHGRGRGDRLEEEQWGNGPGWWNQSFHPRPFPHLQFQQPFGFYVNHMLGLMPRMPDQMPGPMPGQIHPQFHPQMQMSGNQPYNQRPH